MTHADNDSWRSVRRVSCRSKGTADTYYTFRLKRVADADFGGTPGAGQLLPRGTEEVEVAALEVLEGVVREQLAVAALVGWLGRETNWQLESEIGFRFWTRIAGVAAASVTQVLRPISMFRQLTKHRTSRRTLAQAVPPKDMSQGAGRRKSKSQPWGAWTTCSRNSLP